MEKSKYRKTERNRGSGGVQKPAFEKLGLETGKEELQNSY